MILAFSMAGTIYPWVSIQVLGLLAVSIVVWVLFLKAEARAEEPIVDLQVLKNRTFITLASAGLLSSFGMAGLMIYYPLLMQGVQSISATGTGQLMTPGNVLMNFLGVPTGFIIARTKRYKWMFVLGYGLTLMIMIAVIFFNAATPVWWGWHCVHTGRNEHGIHPHTEHACGSICRSQTATGCGDGRAVFQRHDRTVARACDSRLSHEHEIHQHAESVAASRSVPISGSGHYDLFG